MDKDAVFRGSPERACDFEFNEEVAEVFDDILVRSVPFYLEQQDICFRESAGNSGSPALRLTTWAARLPRRCSAYATCCRPRLVS